MVLCHIPRMLYLHEGQGWGSRLAIPLFWILQTPPVWSPHQLVHAKHPLTHLDDAAVNDNAAVGNRAPAANVSKFEPLVPLHSTKATNATHGLSS